MPVWSQHMPFSTDLHTVHVLSVSLGIPMTPKKMDTIRARQKGNLTGKDVLTLLAARMGNLHELSALTSKGRGYDTTRWIGSRQSDRIQQGGSDSARKIEGAQRGIREDLDLEKDWGI